MSKNKKIHNSNNSTKDSIGMEEEIIITETNDDVEETPIEEDSSVVVAEKSEEDNIIRTTVGPIYRVRLSWDNMSSQIFSGTDPNDAINEAELHEGYKVFKGESGELYNDPWENPAPKKPILCEKTLVEVQKNRIVVLDDEPIYKDCMDISPMMRISGTFYWYDDEIMNKRGRITVHKDIHPKDRNVRLILGYVQVKK